MLLVLDVSGSMGDPAGDGARPSSTSPRPAAISALDEFKDEDEVGLRVFTPTSAAPTRTSARSCRSGRSARTATSWPSRSTAQLPTNGTPLYDVTQVAYEDDGRRVRPRQRSTPSSCSPTA